MSPEQKDALSTVLSSPDLVEGRAGTGKRYLTKATVQQIVDRLGRAVCEWVDRQGVVPESLSMAERDPSDE